MFRLNSPKAKNRLRFVSLYHLIVNLQKKPQTPHPLKNLAVAAGYTSVLGEIAAVSPTAL